MTLPLGMVDLLHQQTLDRNILIQLFPVNTETAADQPPLAALGARRLPQPREPGEGGGDFPAVGEQHAQGGGRDANVCGEGLNLILEGPTRLLQEPVLILLDQILQPSASPPPEMK